MEGVIYWSCSWSEMPTYSVRLVFRSLGRSINVAVLVSCRLGGLLLVLFDAASTPLSSDSTTCRGRIDYQNVSNRHFDILHSMSILQNM